MPTGASEQQSTAGASTTFHEPINRCVRACVRARGAAAYSGYGDGLGDSKVARVRQPRPGPSCNNLRGQVVQFTHACLYRRAANSVPVTRP